MYRSCMRVEVLHCPSSRLQRWGHDGLARPYWRLYWNATPGWSVRWSGGSERLDPDRVLLIAPETVYEGIGPTPSEHLWLHATGDGLMAEALPGIVALACDAQLRGLCQALRSAPESPSRRLTATALLLLALARAAPRLVSRPRWSVAVAAAMALGERHLHRRVGNDELARAAGMHRCSFIRRFHGEVGLTPQAWHQRQRIAAACLALERGEAIEDTATGLGFCDRHHFSRVFTQLRGSPPAAYRRSAAG
jgi:AraC-like DNA-binding protein